MSVSTFEAVVGGRGARVVAFETLSPSDGNHFESPSPCVSDSMSARVSVCLVFNTVVLGGGHLGGD